MKNLFKRAWESPTITTWFSYFAKSGSLLFVLPLVLTQFQTEEVAVWYLFASIISMGGLADFGFSSTFIRLIAMALGGARDVLVIKKHANPQSNTGAENWELVSKLFSTMKVIYIAVASTAFICLAIFGTLALKRPISQVNDQQFAWLAWGILIAATTVDFYGKIYSNYLEGLFKIALVRRVETVFKVLNILSNIGVLLYSPSLLNLVAVNSFWIVTNTVRNRMLAVRVYDGKLSKFANHPFELSFFKKVWKPAWRGGISGLMSNGLTNLTGVLYAQMASSEMLASYLLALRIITEVKRVSNAPFYSKIPFLVRTRAKGQIDKLITDAQKGMLLSYLVFVLFVILLAFLGRPLLTILNSNVEFADPLLWFLLSIAFLAHRYGAMHMQLYLTTNHVISHIADGISGFIFIVSSSLLLNWVGVYAFPLGMLTGYLGFYSWMAAKYSLESMNIGFWEFEKKALAPPLLLMTIYVLIFLYICA
ncbi:MAG: hypothetical protein K9J17_00420 [Flavobacteriales bacterium]|nr:hypothetical protein [Flavobacteriales bacterium]